MLDKFNDKVRLPQIEESEKETASSEDFKEVILPLENFWKLFCSDSQPSPNGNSRKMPEVTRKIQAFFSGNTVSVIPRETLFFLTVLAGKGVCLASFCGEKHGAGC